MRKSTPATSSSDIPLDFLVVHGIGCVLAFVTANVYRPTVLARFAGGGAEASAV